MEGCESDEFDPTTSSLLAMAEAFMGQNPPRIADAVRCLLALLTQHPPPRIEAHARLELGLTLFHHTNNLLEAREHLDKAVLVAQSVSNLEEVCYQASSVSARILVEQQNTHQAKSLLRTRIDASTRLPYWHLRLLLQLADISMTERDEEGVVSTLNRCVEYARQIDAPFTRLLCSLYKGAFLLVHHRYQEAGEVLNQTSGLMESYHGHKELLIRTFYLVVQVSHLLVAGQIKAAKPHLKQLQQRVKALSSDQCVGQFSAVTSTDPRSLSENFQWLTKQETFSMVYLVSVMHSVQGGYMDKALSYSEKAVQFMSSKDTAKDRGFAVVSILQAHLLEQIVQCLLMKGDVTEAAEKIEDVIGLCHGHPQLMYAHRAVLHTLLGLYAFAMDDLDKATVQLHAALKHTNNGELRTYVSLNLALTYLKMGESHQSELAALMKSLETDSVTDSCQSLRAALHYVRGLFAFTQLKVHDAKRHLRETLLLSNKGDLNRLTTCALILLGQIFLSIGNTRETTDMVNPAVQLASKIPDKNLQVWAVSLLADLHHLTGDRDKETSVRQESNTIAMEIRAEQGRAVQCKQHALTQWTVGEWPVSQDHQLSSLNYSGGKPTHKHKKHHADSSLTPSQPSAETTPTNERLSKKRRRSQDMQTPEEGGGVTSSSGRSLSSVGEGSAPHSSLQTASSGGSSTGEVVRANSSLNQSPTILHKTPELKLKKVATTPTSPMLHPLEDSNEVRSRNLHKERLRGEDHWSEGMNSRYDSPHQASRNLVEADRKSITEEKGDSRSSIAGKRSYDQREQDESLSSVSETARNNVIIKETVIHSGMQPLQSSRHNVLHTNTSSNSHPVDVSSLLTPPSGNHDPFSLTTTSSKTSSRDSYPPHQHYQNSPSLEPASDTFASQPQNAYSTQSYPRLSSLSQSPFKPPQPSSGMPSSRSPVTSLPSTSSSLSSRFQAPPIVSEAESLTAHTLSPPMVSPPPPAASSPPYSGGSVSPYSDLLQRPHAPSQAVHDYNHQHQQHQQNPKPTWQPYQQQQEQHHQLQQQEQHHKLQQQEQHHKLQQLEQHHKLQQQEPRHKLQQQEQHHKLQQQEQHHKLQQQEQHHKLQQPHHKLQQEQQQIASPSSGMLNSGRVSQLTSVDHSSRHTSYADLAGSNQQRHHHASNLSPQISSNFSPQPPSNMSHQPPSNIANQPTPTISPRVPGGTFSPQSASTSSPQPPHSRLPGSTATTNEANPLQVGFKSPPEMGHVLPTDQLSQYPSSQHSPAQPTNPQLQNLHQMQQQSRPSFSQLQPANANFGDKSSSSLFDDSAGFSPDLFDKGMPFQPTNPLLHQQDKKEVPQSVLSQHQMAGVGVGLYSSNESPVSSQPSDLLRHPNLISSSQHRLQQQQQQQLLQQQQLMAQQQQQQLLKQQQLQQQQLKQQQQQLLLQRQQQYMMQRQPPSTQLPQPSLNMPFHSNASQPSMHGQLPGYYPGAGQALGVPSPRKSVQMPQLMHMQPLHRIPGVHDSGMPSAPDLHLTGMPMRNTIPGQGTVPSAGGNALGLSNFPGSLGTVQTPGMHQLPNGGNFPSGSGLLGQPGSQLGHFYHPQ